MKENALLLTPLPIDAHLDEIESAVRENLNVILTATPGAGKTTRLPAHLLENIRDQIIVTQPRRMAAVAAADRVCRERGWELGRECGYQVRFDSKAGASTRLIYMTDALFLRRMISDPELRGVGLLIIDEFHERNLNQDLILGLVRELQTMGRDLKVMVMSATLDTAPLLEFLNTGAWVDVPGLVFPLDLRWSTQTLRLQTDREFVERVAGAAETAAAETSGDVLVFLPGVGEIRRVEERLRERGLRREIRPLHGSLPLSEQREVLRPASTPRVILATNVAEASVTVPGVDFVIDSGVARVNEMNLQSGFESLEVTRISRFNAKQRAGRAAREKPGVAWRLWTSHEEVTQLEELPPECARADLSSALLLLSQFGVRRFYDFGWLTPPPPALLDHSVRALRDLSALTTENELTNLGRELLSYPLPPRWGALLAAAKSNGFGRAGAELAAILSERDFLKSEVHSGRECDMLLRLDILHEGARLGPQGQSVIQAAQQLARLVDGAKSKATEDDIRKLLLMTQKDRLCRRRGSGDRGKMVGGRGVRLAPQTQVRKSEFFLALQGIDIPGQTETLVSLASGFDKDFILKHLKAEITTEETIEFVDDRERFFALRARRFRDLDLEEPTRAPVDPALVADRLATIVAGKWEWLAAKNERLCRWWERWKFFVHHLPEFAAELGPGQIAEIAKQASFGKTKISEIVESDLVPLMEMNLSKKVLNEFREGLPEDFTAPTGFKHRIHYAELHSAFVEVRLQEIFGLDRTPALLKGRLPLTFRLLGPNFRPVQVTSDLPGFWRGAYAEVRKELRARYPKHSWPEDPLSAKPEAKGRRGPTS